MKIKVSKHKLNIHYRGSPWGSRTQQHAYCLRYAHSHHTESHLGKKQPKAKIAITFLFSQLHYNNVTSHALFYGGHIVMRSKRCAVQNQGITLSLVFYENRDIQISKSKKSEQYFLDKIEIFIRLFDEHFARHFKSRWRETWRHTGRRTVPQISLETPPKSASLIYYIILRHEEKIPFWGGGGEKRAISEREDCVSTFGQLMGGWLC